MLKTITGDLLNAKEKYIAHQTNCLSKGGAGGIAYYIFDKYPHSDCYSDRQSYSIPGTIDVRGDDANRRVINIHSQVYPGGLVFPGSQLDSRVARETYFYNALQLIAKIENLESIAFPFKIGCGIADGNWDNYLRMIEDFAKQVDTDQGAQVAIYRRPND